MNPLKNSNSEHAAPCRPSRAHVETLCILHVVPRTGIEPAALAERLGLSVRHASTLSCALDPIVARGHLLRDEARVLLTEAGAAWYTEQLVRFGVG